MSDAAAHHRYDCAIIGAGPAGLTAALYLKRFRRDVILFDTGNSRAKWIPESHNSPGFPDGISGVAYLTKLQAQVARYGLSALPADIRDIHLKEGIFTLRAENRQAWRTRTVVLATGTIDLLPAKPWIAEAIESTAIRLCAICDGYEASGQTIATIGPLKQAVDHAVFLRTYSEHVTAVSTTDERDAAVLARARRHGVNVADNLGELVFENGLCAIVDQNSIRRSFDVIYPVYGCQPQSRLALRLGAALDQDGNLMVDDKQSTTIDGLYAIGDVVSGLNQISVAAGQAAIAATAIHNALRDEDEDSMPNTTIALHVNS